MRTRKTVWYDSRFYRINFLWEDDGFFIRDLHRFDESLTSATHDSALKTRSLAYGTLPVVEGVLWSEKGKHAGGFSCVNRRRWNDIANDAC